MPAGGLTRSNTGQTLRLPFITNATIAITEHDKENLRYPRSAAMPESEKSGDECDNEENHR
jgi:hypothetical protein